MSEHTPGPWRISRHPDGEVDSPAQFTRIYGPQPSRWVADVGYYEAEWKANAHLIAAAPDLLASLKELSEWMRSHCGPSDGVHDMLIRAVAVLAKVEGR
jgi:hypothetical protein